MRHSITYNTVEYIRDIVSHQTVYCLQVEYMRVTYTTLEHMRHSVTHNTVEGIRDVVSHETLDCIQVECIRVI